MTGLTQGKIALIVSFSLLVLQWTFLLVLFYNYEPFHLAIFFLPLISSFLVFFLILILTEYFILSKIRILYRILSKAGKKIERTTIKDPELFEKLSEQVQQFTEQKSSEILALKETEKFRREFIGNVSHELKTPLFTIQGFIDYLIEEVKENKTIEFKYLDKISKNTDRLIDIVNDLTMISQAESQQLKIELTKFSLYELIKEVQDELSELAKKKKTKVEIVILENYFVKADRQKIYQVFFNLIENAIFYCPEKSKISIQVYDLDLKYMIEIADNGLGIEAEHLPKLFNRFYRIDENRSREKGGSGLGLSIVKNILDAHKEQITVESEVEKGTQFKFTLDKA